MSDRDHSESRINAFFRTRVLLPFKIALRAGTAPDKLAMSMTMAVVFGLFPVLGVTSVLCFLAAWRWGLNTPIMQAINLVLTPVDVALSLPFMRLGETLLHRDPLPLSPSQLLDFLKQAGFWNGIGTLLKGLGCALFGWAFVMAPAGAALYYALRPILRRVMVKKQLEREDAIDGQGLEDPLLPRTRRQSLHPR
ncbi:hypothetical protein DFJ77DRAFT_507201 [Powellomyces hirtus]|nr:hypothetical protein DFJ77DRAFT_507201 [Powellomyces hirtus]